jgi:hypothetical protein
MDDTEPQVAAAKVLWHFTMSLDGFCSRTEPCDGLGDRLLGPSGVDH